MAVIVLIRIFLILFICAFIVTLVRHFLKEINGNKNEAKRSSFEKEIEEVAKKIKEME